MWACMCVHVCEREWAGIIHICIQPNMTPFLTAALVGPPLSEDVRGSWSLHHDKFKNKATLRSMLYPGYFYYYDGAAMTFGGLYYGSGLKNTDLVFML